MARHSGLVKTRKTNKYGLERKITVISTRIKAGSTPKTKSNFFECRNKRTRRTRVFTEFPLMDMEDTDEAMISENYRDRLDTKMLEAEVTCGICKELFYEPTVTLNCMHMFCEYCIEEWKHRCPPGTCPICRRLIGGQRYETWVGNVVKELLEYHVEEYRESRIRTLAFRNEVSRIRNRGWTLLDILTSIIHTVNEQLDRIRNEIHVATEELREYRIRRLYIENPPVPWRAVLMIAKHVIFILCIIMLCLFDLHVVFRFFIALLYIIY